MLRILLIVANALVLAGAALVLIMLRDGQHSFLVFFTAGVLINIIQLVYGPAVGGRNRRALRWVSGFANIIYILIGAGIIAMGHSNKIAEPTPWLWTGGVFIAVALLCLFLPYGQRIPQHEPVATTAEPTPITINTEDPQKVDLKGQRVGTLPDEFNQAIPRAVFLRGSARITLTGMLIAGFLMEVQIFSALYTHRDSIDAHIIPILLIPVLIPLILAGGIIARDWKKYSEEKKLAEYGSVVAATIIQEDEYKVGSTTFVKVTYEFTDNNGKKIQGVRKSIPAESEQNEKFKELRTKVYEMLAVLYNPHNSSENMLYPLTYVTTNPSERQASISAYFRRLGLLVSALLLAVILARFLPK